MSKQEGIELDLGETKAMVYGWVAIAVATAVGLSVLLLATALSTAVIILSSAAGGGIILISGAKAYAIAQEGRGKAKFLESAGKALQSSAIRGTPLPSAPYKVLDTRHIEHERARE